MKTTPIIEAIKNNRYEALKLLIELGGSINDSLLGIAYTYSNTDVVKILLDAGTEIDDSELHTFASYTVDNIDILKTLIDYGADPFYHDYQESLTYNFARNDMVECLKYSIENYLDEDLEELFVWAAWCGSPLVARYILERGHDVNYRYSDGETCLHVMCFDSRLEPHGHEDVLRQVVEILVEFGVDFYIKDHFGRTALEIAREYTRDDMIKIIKDFQ